MVRTAVGALAGAVAGVALAAGLLRLAWVVVRWATAPKIFQMDYTAVYLGVVLGAGFGGVCGALAGLAGALTRAAQGRTAPSPGEPAAQPRTTHST